MCRQFKLDSLIIQINYLNLFCSGMYGWLYFYLYSKPTIFLMTSNYSKILGEKGLF